MWSHSNSKYITGLKLWKYSTTLEILKDLWSSKKELWYIISYWIPWIPYESRYNSYWSYRRYATNNKLNRNCKIFYIWSSRRSIKISRLVIILNEKRMCTFINRKFIFNRKRCMAPPNLIWCIRRIIVLN